MSTDVSTDVSTNVNTDVNTDAIKEIILDNVHQILKFDGNGYHEKLEKKTSKILNKIKNTDTYINTEKFRKLIKYSKSGCENEWKLILNNIRCVDSKCRPYLGCDKDFIQFEYDHRHSIYLNDEDVYLHCEYGYTQYFFHYNSDFKKFSERYENDAEIIKELFDLTMINPLDFIYAMFNYFTI